MKFKQFYESNSRQYIDWDSNYGKTFKLVHTPKGAQSGAEWSPSLISVVTPENGDAWKLWKEVHDEVKQNWKTNWDEIQKNLADHKYDQIMRGSNSIG